MFRVNTQILHRFNKLLNFICIIEIYRLYENIVLQTSGIAVQLKMYEHYFFDLFCIVS